VRHLRPRLLLVVANLFGWLLVLALREPMSAVYFAERDAWRSSGTIHLNSAYPALVIAGRPLWSWSPYHGGEAWPVKVLEVANVPALLAAFVADATCFLLGSSAYTSSIVGCAALLVVSSAQWWVCGRALERLRARHSGLASRA
jgi:hypothetical protein